MGGRVLSCEAEGFSRDLSAFAHKEPKAGFHLSGRITVHAHTDWNKSPAQVQGLGRAAGARGSGPGERVSCKNVVSGRRWCNFHYK